MQVFTSFISSTSAPLPDEMLNFDLWEMHEALFMLTSWPEHIVKNEFKDRANRSNLARTYIYQPGPPEESKAHIHWKFNLSEMESEFQIMYAAMKEDVFSLNVKVETIPIGDVYNEKLSYFISPRDAIKWALLKGFDLSQGLQNAIGINIKKGNSGKSIQDKIRNKIVGQFLWGNDPTMRVAFCCRHPWMMKYGTAKESEDPTFRAIRHALNELRPTHKVRGNRSGKSLKNEIYTPMVIKEVVYNDNETRSYHIPHLKYAMETAALLLYGESIRRNTLEQFLDRFMNNNVIKLYIDEASALIREFIYEFAFHKVFDLFYYKERSELIRSWIVPNLSTD